MTTKFRIVETEEYTLAVSDEEIKLKDWYVHNQSPKGLRVWQDNTQFIPMDAKKIIAYKPKGNAPELDLPLLPDVEDDVKKLFEEEAKTVSFGENGKQSPFNWFKTGHKAATKVYSEEDLRRAINMARGIKEGKETFTAEDISGSTEVCTYGWKFEFDEDEIIQSLKQPKWFVAEIEVNCTGNNNDGCFMDSCGHNCGCLSLKTTTINNKIHLVGTYLN
jgi:hypothetical protein